MIATIVILGILMVLVIGVIAVYNSLVALRNRYKNAYSQIDVQLKRRYDLIPNLVETAKGYLKHEREVLESVIKARNQAFAANQSASARPGEAGPMQALMGAETALTGAMGKLFALAESYPDLKANQTMAQLMEELTSTENKVSFARQAYNDAVMVYNTAREKFPNMLIANSFNFQEAVLFEVSEPQEREPVKVSF